MMIMTRLMRVATTAAIAASAASAAVPRAVRVDGQQFVLAETNASVVLAGPNVVVKGPPYLPSVSGSTICNDVVNDECKALGNCAWHLGDNSPRTTLRGHVFKWVTELDSCKKAVCENCGKSVKYGNTGRLVSCPDGSAAERGL